MLAQTLLLCKEGCPRTSVSHSFGVPWLWCPRAFAGGCTDVITQLTANPSV